jgi:hypothetical protein
MSTAIENDFKLPIVIGLALQRTSLPTQGSRPQALVARGSIYTKTPNHCQQIIKVFSFEFKL